MKIIIISGAESKYYEHLNLLCSFLKLNNVLTQSDFGILDTGLSYVQKKKFEKFTKKILRPNWDFKINFKTENWKKLLTVRPHLKKYLPGYDIYIWIDADMIPLSNNFLSSIIEVFKYSDKEICIVNEFDNSYITEKKNTSYKKIFNNIYKVGGWVFKNNHKYLGPNIADKLLGKPLMNAGFFAIKNKSNIWDEWKDIYGKIIEKHQEEYCLSMDQSSLNLVLYNCIKKVNFFDAKFNWLNKNSLPIIKNNRLCKPLYPYEKIEILHNTSFDINRLMFFQEFEKQEKINVSLDKILRDMYKL